MKTYSKNALLILISFLFGSCQTTKIKQWTSDDILVADNADLAFPKEISSMQAAHS